MAGNSAALEHSRRSVTLRVLRQRVWRHRRLMGEVAGWMSRKKS